MNLIWRPFADCNPVNFVYFDHGIRHKLHYRKQREDINFAQIQTLRTILDKQKFKVVIERLSHQLIENHGDFNHSVLIGIQPRGIFLAERILSYTQQLIQKNIPYGKLDITFYRDDFKSGKEILIPSDTNIDFSLEGKKVILVDDVLFTGRTIRSAMDAILDFGRPDKVELMTLIDRRFSREFPIQADYVGLTIDSIITQKVKVYWKAQDKKDEVVLLDHDKKES